MGRVIRKSKVLPVILLALIILTSFCISIRHAEAGSGFASVKTVWSNETDSIDASKEDFPYNGESVEMPKGAPSSEYDKIYNANVKSVSINIPYGITKDLVTYHGELPWHQTHTNDGDSLDGWAGYPYVDGTTWVDSEYDSSKGWGNPDFAGSTVTVNNYWGNVDTSILKSDNFQSKNSVESVNKTKVVSLRLYALQHTKTGILVWLGNLAYIIARFFAWLGAMFITLVVAAKNLDMDFILEALHVKKLGEVLTENFIGGGKLGLSPFTGFCIIMFMFAVVAYAIRWVKGSEKTKGIWSIIGTALLGAVFIGVCLAGKWEDLGSTAADAAGKMTYAVANSLTSGTEGDAFVIDVSGDKSANKVTQMQELALVYKPFIDIQICTQFNVDSIDDLSLANLGDSGGANAKTYLAGLGSSSMHDDFNDNLGYYYWFANSSATEKVPHNTKLPSTSASACENKLNSMITYLQVQYNSSSSSTIVDIMDGLSDPKTGTGFLLMLGFTVVMVLLALVLVKYAINVLIAKLELFVALLGLVVAGPLILTNKDKLVKTGKSILGMLLIAFLEITVWSIFFDMILYTVAVMMAATIGRMLVTIAFLLLFLKLNPVISQKIKEMLDSSTRAISPEFHQARNAAKQKVRQYTRDAARKIDSSTKTVGYDDDGNPITMSRKGGIASRMANLAANATEDAHNRKSWVRLGHEASKSHSAEKTKVGTELANVAKKKRETIEEQIAVDADNTARIIKADGDRAVENALDRDVSGNVIGYNTENLNAAEAKLAAEVSGLEEEEKALMNDPEYRALLEEKRQIDDQNVMLPADEQVEMDATKKARLEELQTAIARRRQELDRKKSELVRQVRDRAMLESANRRGMKITRKDDDESMSDAVVRASKIAAQNDHLDEYKEALQAEVNAHAANNDKKVEAEHAAGLIVTMNTVQNKTAIEAQTVAAIKLSELEAGEEVSSDAKAREEAKGIVNYIERTNSTSNGAASSRSVEESSYDTQIKNAEKYASQFKRGSAEREKAEQEIKTLKAAKEEYAKTAKTSDKIGVTAAKADSGRVKAGNLTISEQINSAVKHRDQINLQTESQASASARATARTEARTAADAAKTYRESVTSTTSTSTTSSVSEKQHEDSAKSIIKANEVAKPKKVETAKPEPKVDDTAQVDTTPQAKPQTANATYDGPTSEAVKPAPTQTAQPRTSDTKPVIKLNHGATKAVDKAAAAYAVKSGHESKLDSAKQAQEAAAKARLEAEQARKTASTKAEKRAAKADEAIAKAQEAAAKKEVKKQTSAVASATTTYQKADKTATAKVDRAVEKGIQKREKELDAQQKKLEKAKSKVFLDSDAELDFERRSNEIIAERERLRAQEDKAKLERDLAEEADAASQYTTDDESDYGHVEDPKLSQEDRDNFMNLLNDTDDI